MFDFSGSSGASTINASSYTGGLLDVLGHAGFITVDMGANDTLRLDDPNKYINPHTFNGLISGFAVGDTIDLQDIATTGSDAAVLGAGDVLTVTESDGVTTTLQLSGSFGGNSGWVTSSDGAGGTEIRLEDIEISPDDPSFADQSPEQVFTLTRFGDVSRSEIVYVSTTDGSTVSGESTNNNDFDPLSSEAVTFAAGSATADFDVSLNKGNEAEDTATFGVQVTGSAAANATVLASDQFTMPPVPPAIAAFKLVEGGVLTQTGADSWVLNLGETTIGGLLSSVVVTRKRRSKRRNLSGVYDIASNTTPFADLRFFPFSDVQPGATDTGGLILFDPTTYGSFSETITLAPVRRSRIRFAERDFDCGRLGGIPALHRRRRRRRRGRRRRRLHAATTAATTGPAGHLEGDVHLTTFEGLH